MKLIQRKYIDDAKWNDCVIKSPNGLAYGLTWYLDGLVEQWSGLVLEKDDEYKAVFPIPFRKKFGLKYVYPPFFIQQLGLFSAEEEFKDKEIEARSILEKQFKFIELNLNWQSQIGEQRTNLVLDLGKEYLEIQKDFSSNHKRNLKKVESNLTINKPSPRDVISLFQHGRGAGLDTFKEEDYNKFEATIKTAIQRGNAFTRGVYLNQRLVSGAIFLKFKNRIIFLFSGTSDAGKEKGALFFLLDSIIRDYAKSGFVLDFEGSQNEGLARFYRGFGAVEQNYRFLKINNLPKILRRFKS